MTFSARRPWWKKKRWAAALGLWLLAAYVLSIGPACYCGNRQWLGPRWTLLYLPLSRAATLSRPTSDLYRDYQSWWAQMAVRHWLERKA